MEYPPIQDGRLLDDLVVDIPAAVRPMSPSQLTQIEGGGLLSREPQEQVPGRQEGSSSGPVRDNIAPHPGPLLQRSPNGVCSHRCEFSPEHSRSEVGHFDRSNIRSAGSRPLSLGVTHPNLEGNRRFNRDPQEGFR